MSKPPKEVPNWKQKALHELMEYWGNSLYLAIFFGAFTLYRRLIMAEYGMRYVHYGIAVIEALVLAKIVMIGDALKLGRKFTDKPLIYPTLNKAVIFTVWVGIFSLLEHTVIGVLEGKGIEHGFQEIVHEGWDALLAQCLVTFIALIPFFAFKELEQLLGRQKLLDLFFRQNNTTNRPGESA